jgi:hypothetical protein
MILIYGSRMYGRVDEVPGFFYVTTKFGHLWYFPLIPLESRLILEKTSQGAIGVSIPLSWKSILLAWVRAGSLVCGLGSLLPALALAENGGNWLAPATTGAIAFVVLLFSLRYTGFRRASYEKAKTLGDHVRLSEAGKIAIDLAYGQITEEEAKRALAALEA